MVGDALFTKAKLIKDLGNQAVHGTRPVSVDDAVVATRELFHFCYWLTRTYGQRSRPDPDLRFSANHLPKAAQPKVPVEQLRALETQLHEKDEKLSELLNTQAALDEELQRLRRKSPPPSRPTPPSRTPTTTPRPRPATTSTTCSPTSRPSRPTSC